MGRQVPEKRLYAVGCYRSHTREGLGLSPKKRLLLFDTHFPELSNVFSADQALRHQAQHSRVLLPRGGRAMRTAASYLEFPFRRRELGGGSAPSKLRSVPDSDGK